MPPGYGTAHRGFGPCRSHGNRDEHEGWIVALEIAREEHITPWDALLKSVRLAAGRVSWVDEQLTQAVRANDGDMNQPNVAKWLKESRLERTLLAKMGKAAIDAGVAERMVRQVELEGQLVAEALVHALDVLELTAEQRTIALEAAHARLLSASGSQTLVVQGTVLHDDSGTSRNTNPDSSPPDAQPDDYDDDDDGRNNEEP